LFQLFHRLCLLLLMTNNPSNVILILN